MKTSAAPVPPASRFNASLLRSPGAATRILLAAAFGLLLPLHEWAAERQVLHGHVPAVVSRLVPVGRLPVAQHVNLAIGLPPRNQQGLTDLIRRISDPASPDYRHYLTPQEFAARFGPSEQDYETVAAFAKAHGLTVTRRYPNRVVLDVGGAVSDIEKALHVTMRLYKHPTEGRVFYAPDTEPSLDLAVPLSHISGLDNYALPKPCYKRMPVKGAPGVRPGIASARPAIGGARPEDGSGPNGTYMGRDFRAAYVPGVSLTGSGQVVGLLQFDGYTASDITAYESEAGLPNVTLTNVLLDGFNGQPTGNGGEVEVSLDIEMVISMAPGVSEIILYEAGPYGNWDDIISQMVSDNKAKQLGASWQLLSSFDDPTADTIFQEMAVQGQSFFNASGDSDADVGPLNFPSDNPYITVVGGTTLTTTGPEGAWSSETVWNWGSGEGSSGGISTIYSIPVWQQGISMTTNGGSTTMRNIPDVALTADNIDVRADGSDQSVGGTSCATPLWAAFTALVNQQAAEIGKGTVGFINPAVYAIGNSSAYPSDFHDITTGDNTSPSSPNEFYAVKGYDLCTGLGTPIGAAMINALVLPSEHLEVSSNAFNSSGPEGGPFTPGSVGYTLTNSGTSAVTWSAGAAQSWISLSATGGTIAAKGSTTVTASINSNANALVSGTTYSGVITFTDVGSGYAQTRAVGLTVIAPPAINSPLAATAINGEPFSYQIAASNNPTSYNATGLPPGLSIDTATGLISGAVTSLGSSNVVISASNVAGTGSATLVITVQLPPPPVIITGNSLATLYPFTGGNDGGDPVAGLVQGKDGNLYGTTESGGANYYGTVFKITTSGSLTTLHAFADGPDGAEPEAGLVQGKDGNFYGTTYGDGYYTYGSVFKITSGGALTPLYSFTDGDDGAHPAAGLVQGSDGNFYGTTAGDGNYTYGSVFKITPGGSLTPLYSFTGGNDGGDPVAGLVLGSDGNFYGTTEQGGLGGSGTVFQITASGTLTTLYSFADGDGGGFPLAGLVQGTDGNFYGTTEEGGGNSYGTVFQITASGSLTTLYSFSNGVTTGNDGAYPVAELVQGNDGNFYGTTESGGSNSYGTVFQISPEGTLTTLYSFTDGNDGAEPEAGLVLGKDGNFYGTAATGGASSQGTVFALYASLSVSATAETAFSYQITATNYPTSYNATGLPPGLSVDTATGLISGTATATGTSSVVISAINEGGTGSATLTLTVAPQVPPVITSPLTATATIGLPFSYQITAANSPANYNATGLPPGLGVNTATGLISGTPTAIGSTNVTISAANLAGSGSATLSITVQLPPPPVITTGNSLITLHPFTGGNDGGLPDAGLVQGKDGNLYGTTEVGGTNNYGTVFKITTSGSLTPLYSFADSNDGANPEAGLVQGSDGNFYGTTRGDGYSTYGTVFKITPGGSLTALYSFTDSTDGAYPQAGLVQGKDGGFYGTNRGDGYSTFGTVFKITSGGSLTPLHSFTGGNDGGYPVAALVQGHDGNFYGTTEAGGNNGFGTVFKITPGGSLTTLYSFADGNDGAEPLAGLIQTSNGNLYGTTFGDRHSTFGTVFQITTSGSLTPLCAFTGGNDGGNPVAGLVLGSNGDFYGTTEAGGSGYAGTVFQITTSGSLTTAYPFADGNDGGYPLAGLVPGSSGNFYGTTSEGGASNQGTVFELNPSLFASGIVGTAFSYQIAATNNPTSYNATGLPAGLSVDTATGLISGTAMATGTTTATVSATNLGGTGSAALVITVQPQIQPVITSPLAATATLDAAFSYQITATNNPTNFDAAGLPAGLSVDTATGVVSGTATATGTSDVTITASAAGITGSATLVLTVLLPLEPVIISGSNVSGTEGAPFNYQITATGNPTSFGASGLPPGLSLDAGTGLISGTPTATGTFSATISATNAGGTQSAPLVIVLDVAIPVIAVQQPAGSNLTSGSSTADFGVVPFGTAAQQTFTLFNNGAANLTGLAAGITGANALEFHAAAPGAATLSPGTSTTLAVTYSPGDIHASAATLHITSNDPVTPSFDIALAATGTSAPINFKFAAGTFAGLMEASGTGGGTAFAGYTTLTMGRTGKVTGKVFYGEAASAVKGGFDNNGIFSGLPSGFSLILSSGSGGESIPAGYWMSGSMTAGNGTAPFKAYHAAYGSKEPVPEKGKYTVLLGATGTSASIPQGTGYALATVANTGGHVTMKGKLADGTAFGVSGVLVTGPNGDQFLVFDPKLYNNAGLFAGSIVFEQLPGSDCDGIMEWTRPDTGSGTLYPQGFDANLDLTGALYVKPGSGVVLPLFVSGTLALSDGGLSAPILQTVAVSPQGTFEVTGSNQYQIEIRANIATGKVSGSFLPGAAVSTTPVPFSGVLYQNATLPRAGGFFIGPVLSGTSLSGNVMLTP